VPRVLEIVRHFLDGDKPVAAVRHAVLILAAAGSLEGRTLTRHPQRALDVRVAGGAFVGREVVVRGYLVAARAWNDDAPWMREFVKLARARLA